MPITIGREQIDRLSELSAEQLTAGKPMPRWAVIAELGMIAGAPRMPAPTGIRFYDTENTGPVLSLRFENADDRDMWALQILAFDEVGQPASAVLAGRYRGYVLQLWCGATEYPR